MALKTADVSIVHTTNLSRYTWNVSVSSGSRHVVNTHISGATSFALTGATAFLYLDSMLFSAFPPDALDTPT